MTDRQMVPLREAGDGGVQLRHVRPGDADRHSAKKEKDEFRIAELKTEMTRLDGDLVAEIKRRKEMNKSTQVWFEEQLTMLDTSFHATLKERSVHAKLETLDVRIPELDKSLRRRS